MKTVEITLPKKIGDMIKEVMSELGYKSEQEFVSDAVSSRLLAIKKAKYTKLAEKINGLLKTKKISPDDILIDFEIFREKNYHCR